MVSAYRADALRDPTSELRELFTRCRSSEDFAAEVTKHFSSVFDAEDAFAEIPILDLYHPPESYPDRSIVRFRAMVQDTSPSSEMYLRKTPAGSLGGWGAHEGDDANNQEVDYSQLRECNILWAVSVPGESKWCREELGGTSSKEHSQTHVPQRAYKYPDLDGPHIGVQVKFYDLSIAEKLKSTDLVTFVGILTREPLDVEADTTVDVPTLHVLFTRTHERALLNRPYPSAPAAAVREELIQWIAAEALGGDIDAAEWILLSIIARVQSRNPPLLPPSLTLSHFPSPAVSLTASSTDDAPTLPTPALSQVLSQLLPLLSTLPLSLATMNKLPFAPESKDEDLHSGMLQLPQGTTLLVTEGGVREGKLVERGLMNINVLQEVISSQTLRYNFPFSQFSFPTDISCVILSEGKKSTFFKTDLYVPLQINSTEDADVSNLYKSEISLPDQAKLAAFRDLVVGAQAGKVQVSESTSEYIQQDFVRDRQQNQAVTGDDLIRRMTVAKLYALSKHETELSIEVWEKAKAFDERRIARLAAL